MDSAGHVLILGQGRDMVTKVSIWLQSAGCTREWRGWSTGSIVTDYGLIDEVRFRGHMTGRSNRINVTQKESDSLKSWLDIRK